VTTEEEYRYTRDDIERAVEQFVGSLPIVAADVRSLANYVIAMLRTEKSK
jgi:hypothetical protein